MRNFHRYWSRFQRRFQRPLGLTNSGIRPKTALENFHFMLLVTVIALYCALRKAVKTMAVKLRILGRLQTSEISEIRTFMPLFSLIWKFEFKLLKIDAGAWGRKAWMLERTPIDFRGELGHQATAHLLAGLICDFRVSLRPKVYWTGMVGSHRYRYQKAVRPTCRLTSRLPPGQTSPLTFCMLS